jgi:hypothetical protein
METVTTAHATQQQCCESEAVSYVGHVKNVTKTKVPRESNNECEQF